MFTLIIEDKHGGIADEYSFEEGEFYVGRSHTSDIILPSDNVSRRHSRLYTVDGRCYIEDLNSSNGVFVNGRRIHEVFQIQRSAQIKIGDYYLHIESDDAPDDDDERTFCKLSGQNLSFTNQVFRVQRKVSLIGRGKDCTVTIIDPSVSRIHAKLTAERSGVMTLEDLKSSNGTFVNDERIEVTTLNHRDLIRFGNVEFLCEVPDAAAAPPRSTRVRRPTDQNQGRHRFSTTAAPAYEEDWGAQRRKPKTLWLALSIVLGLLILAGILFAIFKDDIIGKPEPPPATSIAQPDDSAAREKLERERREREIDDLLQVAADRVKARQWDLALEALNKILDRNAIQPQARETINLVRMFKEHKALLEDARRLAKELKRGEAAKKLYEILEQKKSEYYGEANAELQKLKQDKPTMLSLAENAIRRRECDEALDRLKEIQQIDPRDVAVIQKIDEVTKKLGTRKCKGR